MSGPMSRLVAAYLQDSVSERLSIMLRNTIALWMIRCTENRRNAVLLKQNARRALELGAPVADENRDASEPAKRWPTRTRPTLLRSPA